mgnify:CR=1 FL=1
MIDKSTIDSQAIRLIRMALETARSGNGDNPAARMVYTISGIIAMTDAMYEILEREEDET